VQRTKGQTVGSVALIGLDSYLADQHKYGIGKVNLVAFEMHVLPQVIFADVLTVKLANLFVIPWIGKEGFSAKLPTLAQIGRTAF
jgi:hypothetical protein